MNEKRKSLIADLIVGALIAVAVIAMNWNSGYPLSQRLCDGFFVAGVVLVGLGGIKFARNKGTFDVAGYGLKTALHAALPFLGSRTNQNNREEDFMDYRERKEKARKPAAAELWAGLVYMVLAVAMLAVYMLTA